MGLVHTVTNTAKSFKHTTALLCLGKFPFRETAALWLWWSLCLFFPQCTEPGMRGYDTHTPFMAGYSAITYFLHLDQLWISVSITILISSSIYCCFKSEYSIESQMNSQMKHQVILNLFFYMPPTAQYYDDFCLRIRLSFERDLNHKQPIIGLCKHKRPYTLMSYSALW